MAEPWLRRQGVRGRVTLTYSTYEPRRRDHGVRRPRIAGHTSEAFTGVGPDEAWFTCGATCHFDELVAFPPSVAAVRYEGPADEAEALGRPRQREYKL